MEAPHPAPFTDERRMWPWILGAALLGLAAWAFSLGQSPEAKAKAAARRTIQVCWDESKRPSLPPSAQRLAAGACERMEADFRQRYGLNP